MKQFKLVIISFFASSFLGCAIVTRAPLTGILYSDTKFDGDVTEAYGGTARGESCAMSILGLYSSGDASIDAAKKVAGIVQVTAVDHSTSNILTLYAKYCTVVYGKKAAVAAAAPRPAAPAAPAMPAAPAATPPAEPKPGG